MHRGGATRMLIGAMAVVVVSACGPSADSTVMRSQLTFQTEDGGTLGCALLGGMERSASDLAVHALTSCDAAVSHARTELTVEEDGAVAAHDAEECGALERLPVVVCAGKSAEADVPLDEVSQELLLRSRHTVETPEGSQPVDLPDPCRHDSGVTTCELALTPSHREVESVVAGPDGTIDALCVAGDTDPTSAEAALADLRAGRLRYFMNLAEPRDLEAVEGRLVVTGADVPAERVVERCWHARLNLPDDPPAAGAVGDGAPARAATARRTAP